MGVGGGTMGEEEIKLLKESPKDTFKVRKTRIFTSFSSI